MSSRRVFLALLFAAPVTLSAQAERAASSTASGMGRAQAPGTISGVVTDANAQPLEGATVLIRDLDKRARTGADGIFHLVGVKAGTYEVNARKVGYFPVVLHIEVDKAGSRLDFKLERNAQRMAPVITASFRGGISGVVTDTSNNVLPEVEVDLMAGSGWATTDSAGAFHIPT